MHMDDSEPRAMYQIGELAARSGITRDALRYYERLGLVQAPQRTRGGFRVYPAETLDRLGFILASMQKWFDTGLNPVLNQVLSTPSSSK